MSLGYSSKDSKGFEKRRASQPSPVLLLPGTAEKSQRLSLTRITKLTGLEKPEEAEESLFYLSSLWAAVRVHPPCYWQTGRLMLSSTSPKRFLFCFVLFLN